MGKIFKNMIPYWKWILFIIVFLIIQAFCDLSLPEYTSDIIDVGIQNHGVGHILPEKMTEEDYEAAQFFMVSDEKDKFAGCYEKTDDGYALSADEKTLDEMDEDLIVPLVMVYQMSQEQASGETADEASKMQAMSGEQLTDDMILSMREQLQDKIDSVGTTTLKSMGVAYAVSCDKNAGKIGRASCRERV